MRMLGAGLAIAAVAGMTVPAEAGERKPKRHHHHRDKDKFDGGDVIGALVLGGLFALATSKKKAPPPPVVEDIAYEADAPQPIAGPLSADDAADICGHAAENAGARMSRIAQARHVSAVDPAGEGWFVRGSVELRDSYRAAAGEAKGFRCSIGTTGLPSVTFDGDAVAAYSPR